MSRLVHQTVQSKEFSNVKLRGEFLDRLRKCDVLRSLVDIVPAYAKLIATTKPIPEAIGNEVRNILYPAIAHVLTETRKFCGKPIFAFFDDVQWIDPGSKSVLSYLLENNVPILLIVAYRDRSSQCTFALDSLFSRGDTKALPIQPVGLSLHDLSEEDTRELINYLALSDEDKNTLSDAIFKQTEGNPFFLRFRLSTMAETGALAYDVDSRLWRLDKIRVALTTAVTAEDAVEYCAAMLRTLDYEVTSVLCRLAMMPQGRSLDEYTATLEHEKGVVALAKLKSSTVAEVIRTAVAFSVQKSLLYYGGGGFRFAHDRLQNAAASQCEKNEGTDLNYYLGVKALPTSQCSSEQAYQVLDHFSKSRELVTDPDLILRICTLVPEICAFYVTAGSHEQLDDMLQFARELFQKLGDEKRNSDAFSSLEVRLLIAHHRIKFLMNDIDAAEMLFDDVRPRLQTPADIRDAYEVRISLLINSASHHKAIEATAEALALLDERSLPKGLVLSDGQLAALVGEVTQEIKDLFAERAYNDVLQVANSLAVSEDENHNFRVEIMISVIPSMYLIGRFDLYMYVPALACRSILKNGVTRSAGNAFSVLGFALVAIFSDSFGAEVAMIGKNLVDRFDNHVCTCRAYCMSGIAVIFDQRYEQLASRLLYASYTAGRTAHDLVWANYSIYLLGGMFIFEGVALPKIFDKLEDLNAYAMSSGHQALTQGGLRSTLHTVSILMQGKSTEEPVFHFTIPSDEITKAQPLLGLSHGTLALVALFFDEKLEIAWQIVSEILANGLDKSAPGLPIFFIFHLYAAVVAHGVLVGSTVSGHGEKGSRSISEEDRDKLKEVMKSSSKLFDNLNGMAPIFTPFAHVAKACIADAIDDKPLDALKLFESAVIYVSKEKPGKHFDLVAVSQLISASICQRAKLTSIQAVYFTSAICTLEQWGAQHVAERLSREIESCSGSGSQSANTGSSQAGAAHLLSSNGSNSLNLGSLGRLTTPSTGQLHPSYTPRSDPKHAPDFASVLTIASYITSFSSFDELTEKLSSTLLKQATATRFLLLMRHPETGMLEPTAQYTLEGLSAPDTLRNANYSAPIVKVTEQLQEIVVVHSAQQESPYCFQPYIRESGVCSVASLPIVYQNSLVAIIYMEHEFTQGVFSTEIMNTMALLSQHVASAIVNARLLRDVRKRTTQLEQSHAILAKALRVKDTILSNTSHELRTPLNGIIGLNECILTSGVALDPEVQSCMDTTLVLAKDLLRLVSDILDLSRVNKGSLRLNYQPTSLHSLVKNVLDVTKFTSNNIRLVNDVSRTFPKIMVDSARLKQVIFNLTANAVKFTSEGSVTIASELLDDGRMIMISVTDTGIGIDPAHFDLVFEPFGQVESYETRQHEGAGLGLSITKELVMLHGGRIDLRSKVGEGTSFRVFIPTTPPDLSEEAYSDGDDSASQIVNPATSTTIIHPELIPEDTKGQQQDKSTSAIIVNRNVKREKGAGRSIHAPNSSMGSSMGSIAVVEGEEEDDVRNNSVNQEPLRVLVVSPPPPP
jgi:signal transduction histidine kinase/predicted ATPase